MNAGAVKLQSKRQARQYMNRKVRCVAVHCWPGLAMPGMPSSPCWPRFSAFQVVSSLVI